jgi:hypothetical protein
MKPKGNEDELRMPAADFDQIMGKVMGADDSKQALTVRERVELTKACETLSQMTEGHEGYDTIRDNLVAELVDKHEWTQSKAEGEVDRCVKAARASRSGK